MSVEVLQAFEKPLLHSSVLLQQQQYHRCQLASSQAANMLGSLPLDLGSWQQEPQQQQNTSQQPASCDDSQAIETRKLVILGLPWTTDEVGI